MKNYWKDWNFVKNISAVKKIIFYGRSEDWVHKTLRNLKRESVECIIDMNKSYHNTNYMGLKINSPSFLKDINKNNFYIIITAGPYESVVEDLEKMGFLSGENFCCTPELYDWAKLIQIKNYEKQIIFSCSDYELENQKEKRKSKLGGGLYYLNTGSGEIEKKISGQIRQVIRFKNKYLAVDHFKKIVLILDKKLNIEDEINLDNYNNIIEKPNFCGICVDEKRKHLFIANAGTDTINIIDLDNYKTIERINFSEKYKISNSGQHHINDIEFKDDHLIISYFSFSGNWKNGVMDGGVCELKPDKPNSKNILISDLWMPHSVKYLNGNICVLDSMRGKLIIGNEYSGYFPGFARGLDYDGIYYYVGQSECMYVSRLFGHTKNVVCNAGIYIFDSHSKSSRYFNLPDIMNVHDIIS